MLNEKREKVEFIESYIKIGNGDYEWNDNHGELIRCDKCVYRTGEYYPHCVLLKKKVKPDFYCGFGKKE